jgi:hypothetical protein
LFTDLILRGHWSFYLWRSLQRTKVIYIVSERKFASFERSLSFCLKGLEEVSLFGGESKALQFLGLCTYLGGAPLWVYRSGCDKNAGRRKKKVAAFSSVLCSQKWIQGRQQQQHCEWAISFPRLTILFESCTIRREEGVKLGSRVQGIGFRHQHHGRRSATAGTEDYC